MKELQDQYSALCQRLGDAIYKKSILDAEITELQAQIKSLNLLNASIQLKKPEDALKQFIEKRKKETGASSIEVADSSPL
jgi:prefoldin subunit 5